MTVPTNAEIAPILITSPLGRSGTTLLQRMMCSAENGICFGEQAFRALVFMTTFCNGHLQMMAKNGTMLDELLASVLSGSTSKWMPELFPPMAEWNAAVSRLAFTMPTACADFARRSGRPVWGAKAPGYDLKEVLVFLTLIPGSKLVFVYRNVFDTLRSYKARKWITDKGTLARFCSEWVANTAVLSGPAHDRIMFIRYEDLVSDFEHGLTAFEAFTGLRGIPTTIADVKVNTFVGNEEEGHSPTSYIEPAALSAAETELVVSLCAERMAELYPDFEPPAEVAALAG